MSVAVRFQQKGGTAEEWEQANPVLLEREIGIDMTNRLFKVGDGVHAWKELPYFSPPEVSYRTVLTETDIENRYIELPHDCDTSKVITVVVADVSQTEGTAWEVVENAAPIPDRIAWAGLTLEPRVIVADQMVVTYYKKGVITNDWNERSPLA